MRYIALLRGINVGGKNKVGMQRLKQIFESTGCAQVRTYINSGNVIFDDDRGLPELHEALDKQLKAAFDFDIRLLLVDRPTFDTVAGALPSAWTNDADMKCDVMFLWASADTESVLQGLTIKPGIDTVTYVPGAILWSVGRKLVTKSGMMRIAGTDLYKQMTIRNCNTVRRLQAMLAD